MTNQASSEDKEFIKAFEAFEITPGDFDHRSHIRMVYTYLCENDVPTTYRRVRRVLCEVLAHNEIKPTSKYHETMTQA